MIKFIGYVIKYKSNMQKLARLEEEYICSIEEFVKFVGNVEVL